VSQKDKTMQMKAKLSFPILDGSQCGLLVIHLRGCGSVPLAGPCEVQSLVQEENS
jgi:hypothetical protein